MRRGVGIICLLVASGCSDKADKSAADVAGSSKATTAASAHATTVELSRKNSSAPTAGPVEAPPPPPGIPTDMASSAPERRPLVFQAFTTDDEGRLAQVDVSKTFEDNAKNLTKCLAEDIVITVKMRLLASGRVAEATVPRATPENPRVRDCLTVELRKLVFPRLKSGDTASVQMDIALRK